MRGAIDRGVGAPGTAGARDILSDYTPQLALAADADKLVDNVNLLLTANALSTSARTTIRDAVAAVSAADDAGKLNRVKLAIFMTMAAPDYIVQN
jgi:hypothetical protein